MAVTFKTANVKIPQIVRWRIAGVTDIHIARLLGIGLAALQAIYRLPEYQAQETAYLNGHISAMDKAMAGRVDAIRDECRQAVPAALRALVDCVTQRKDLKAALAASKELLDRDPDRILPSVAKEDEAKLASQVPEAILEAAAERGNSIVEEYVKDATESKPN